jgi:hypothetical protein
VLSPGGVKSEKVVNICGSSLHSAYTLIPENEETQINIRVKIFL